MTRAEGLGALWRTARTLGRRAGLGKLPPLIFVTDPDRTPDPAAVAATLPRGAGVIYRAFGRPDALETGRKLARVARTRGLVLLVGADPRLAAALKADGLHLPERLVGRAGFLRRPGWIVTGAAHGMRGLVRAAGLDAVLLSPVFGSRSPSAGRPLGPVRFAGLVRRARAPVYALGGVDAGTARRLLASGAVGLAAVDGVNEVGGRPG